jgi:hypothetical protein
MGQKMSREIDWGTLKPEPMPPEIPMLTINWISFDMGLHKYRLGWGATYLLQVGLCLKEEKEINLFRSFTNQEICRNLHISYGNLMRFKRKLRDRGFLSEDGILSRI